MKSTRLVAAVIAAVALLVSALPTASAQEPGLEVAPSGGDDTTAIQQTITKAAAQGVGVQLKPGARYITTAELELKSGLTHFNGQGATIVARLAKPADGEPGNVFRFTTGAKGITLTEVKIDLAGSVEETRGVLAASVTDVTISSLEITNFKFRAIDVVANQGPVQNVHIQKNIIKGPQGTEKTAGSQAISVTSHPKKDRRFSGLKAEAYDRFRETGTVAAPEHLAAQVRIEENQIDGGYYGISLSGATDCKIFTNMSTNNVRNLSIQDRSSRNQVRGNDFTESES